MLFRREAYSLAIKLHEKYLGGMAESASEIYGCDIDPAILAKARATPAIQATRFAASTRVFSNATLPAQETSTGCMMRSMKVSFHRTNIIKEQLLPEVDIILLRNVSIYFDTPTRRELHGNLLKMLQPQEPYFLAMRKRWLTISTF